MNRKQRRILYSGKNRDIDLERKSRIEKAMERNRAKHDQELLKSAADNSAVLLFILPMKVLMDNYWLDDPEMPEKIREFTELLLAYYEDWRDDKLDTDLLKKELWDFGGIRLQKVD